MLNTYATAALRTEAPHEPIYARISTPQGLRFLHSALGLVSDVHELCSATDAINTLEELGDILWFLNLGHYALGHADNFFVRESLFRANYTGEECLRVLREESAAYADLVKAHVIYGKSEVKTPSGKVSVAAAFGVQLSTMLSMVVTYARLQGYSLTQVAEANIAKLSARYPDKFTDIAANTRDPAAERTAIANAVA